jgi:hypothetical protein
MINEQEFNSELMNFTGTEKYHRWSILTPMVLTDGMKFVCDKLQCYWLMDIVASVQHKKKIIENESFIVWRIKLNEDNKGFVVGAYRDSPFNKDNLLYEQVGGYTDFGIKEFEFYQCGKVILLTGEY